MPGIASSKPGGSPPKNISRELRAGAARVSVMATAVPTHTRMLPPTKAAGFWCTQPSRTVLKAGGRTNPLPLHLFFAACTLRITRPPRASACTPASPTLPHPARRHLTPRDRPGDASIRCNKADRSRSRGQKTKCLFSMTITDTWAVQRVAASGADASVGGLERLEVSERLHDGRSPAGQVVTRQCDPGPVRRNVGCSVVCVGRPRT